MGVQRGIALEAGVATRSITRYYLFLPYFLDEAAAAALAGDISDPYAAGLTCCYLISACDRVRDYDRAAQWCARLREFSTRQHFAILMTTCRLQYGSVLISRGNWDDAEAELMAAIADHRQKFTRHSFLPIFKLHIWLWQNNPSGTFADWNPKVSCKNAEESEIF